jgi:hypothetical protein
VRLSKSLSRRYGKRKGSFTKMTLPEHFKHAGRCTEWRTTLHVYYQLFFTLVFQDSWEKHGCYSVKYTYRLYLLHCMTQLIFRKLHNLNENWVTVAMKSEIFSFQNPFICSNIKISSSKSKSLHNIRYLEYCKMFLNKTNNIKSF